MSQAKLLQELGHQGDPLARQLPPQSELNGQVGVDVQAVDRRWPAHSYAVWAGRPALGGGGTPTAPSGQHRQKTVHSVVRLRGIGVHTGRPVNLTLKPARPNTGIVFVRADVPPGARIIRAHWSQVESTQLATVIGNQDGLSASTVEHLMAAFRGCGVDNAVVELDGPEVPIVDGSSAPLVSLIQRAGLRTQPQARRYVRVLKTVEVWDGDKHVRLAPADRALFEVRINFQSQAIGSQGYAVELQDGVFQRELAHCRTFGFRSELEALRQQGLALGGSLENAVLVDGDRVVNREGLRCADEFVRHKLLDSIGDLYLAGGPIVGAYSAFKPGHALNAMLLERLFSDVTAWSWGTSEDIWGTDMAWSGLQRAYG